MDHRDDHRDDERTAEVRGALLKALAVLVTIGVVIALGTVLVVRGLGLDEGSGPVGSPSGPVEPLPTSALPDPDGEDEAADDEPRDLVTPDDEPKGGRLQLDASPARAKPMERVNLTGTYRGADNVGLEVQRFENGSWSDFGVSATVRLGTYATYVMTGRPGENRFRVYDPQADRASNAVRVTIG